MKDLTSDVEEGSMYRNAEKDTLNDESPRKSLEIELHNSSIRQEALLAAEKRSMLIQEMENHSGARMLREQMALIEESSVLKHARESALSIKDNAALRTAREQFRHLEQRSILIHTRIFEENPAIARAFESLKSQQELARLAMGPAWELRRIGLFDNDALLHTATVVSQAITEFEARFRLPNHLESALLAK